MVVEREQEGSLCNKGIGRSSVTESQGRIFHIWSYCKQTKTIHSLLFPANLVLLSTNNKTLSLGDYSAYSALESSITVTSNTARCIGHGLSNHVLGTDFPIFQVPLEFRFQSLSCNSCFHVKCVQ